MNTTPSNLIVREYYGDRPCIAPDAMMQLQTWLRPWSKMRQFTRLRPAVYPNSHTQPEFAFSLLELFPKK
jgi:hypothetical protein